MGKELALKSISLVLKVRSWGLLLFIIIFSFNVFSEENKTESSSVESTDPLPLDSPVEKSGDTREGKAVNSSSAKTVESLSPTHSMGFNIRIDGGYSGGGAVSQGFSIPSIRLSGYGTAGKYLDYRLSLGQTREFSTASLAQVLPVEAYVIFNVNEIENRGDSNLKFKAGLFSPTFNPLWTPDLSYLNIPDFNETHRALFLSREAGAELSWEGFRQRLEVSVGAFNGTGVFAENTNNAKAFTGYLKVNFPFESWKISLGTGNYVLKQAAKGSVNYKSTWVTDGFMVIEIPEWKSQLVVDAFSSQFEDSVRSISPKGGSVVLNLGLGKWLGVFGRYEYSTQSPLLSGELRQVQFGPEIYFDDSVKGFFTYTQLDSGGSQEKSFAVRMRLSM